MTYKETRNSHETQVAPPNDTKKKLQEIPIYSHTDDLNKLSKIMDVTNTRNKNSHCFRLSSLTQASGIAA